MSGRDTILTSKLFNRKVNKWQNWIAARNRLDEAREKHRNDRDRWGTTFEERLEDYKVADEHLLTIINIIKTKRGAKKASKEKLLEYQITLSPCLAPLIPLPFPAPSSQPAPPKSRRMKKTKLNSVLLMVRNRLKTETRFKLYSLPLYSFVYIRFFYISLNGVFSLFVKDMMIFFLSAILFLPAL